MARNKNRRHVSDNTLGSFSANAPNVQVTKDGFPYGDEMVLSLNVRYNGTFTVVTPGGSPVTDGGLKILRALTVETDKHKKLIDGVDGLGLFRQLQLEGGTKNVSSDCASNASGTTFGANLRIPFADPKRLLRPYDCGLHVAKSRMTVKRQYGVVTDVQSAGTTPAINPLREDISVEVLPGPINDGTPAMNPDVVQAGGDPSAFSERPGFMILKERTAFPITSNGTLKIPIPMGDRIIRRLYISQQTIAAANGLVTEVSNIIHANASVSLQIGKDIIVDRWTWSELAENAKIISEVETMPTGWAFIEFDESKRIKDMLDCYQYPSGLAAYLNIDVTTQPDANVVLYMDALQLIPDAAKA